MSEVAKYVTTCDCMKKASWGDYVLASDYDKLAKECEQLKTVPMKYRRMEFNARLQHKVALLEAELAELKLQNELIVLGWEKLKAKMEGWQLVPKKPTPEMRTAAIGVEIYADSPAIADCLTWAEAEAIYKAMLAAAPSKEGEV